MLALLAVAFAPLALADDQLYWNVTLDGQPVGYRSATIKWTPEDDGSMRRTVEAWTEIDATVLGFEYQFRERLSATVHRDVAAFHAVSDFSGSITEVQARRTAGVWIVTTAYDGRETTREWSATGIDLSTVDLLDPGSLFPLHHFETAKVLSAESGDIFEGPVHGTGSGNVNIGGIDVPVAGVEWSGDEGDGRFWYSTEGYLVRYEIAVLGRRLIGTLRQPPPIGPDSAPIAPNGGSVREITL